IAVRKGRDNVLALQPGKAIDAIGPAVEAMPGAIEVVELRLAQADDAELRQQCDEVLAMQIVELRPRALAAAHLGHRRLIARPPAVGKIVPVEGITLGCQRRLRLAGDAVAPIYHGAEHVEGQRLYLGSRHLSPSSAAGCLLGRISLAAEAR